MKTKWRAWQRSPQNTWLQVDYLCTDGFYFGKFTTRFVLQCQLLISDMIFVAYELNLPLNMEKPHYRSQRAGEWGLIWAHDSRPIYRALTYIAVSLLGPHQPRYIGLTLYLVKCGMKLLIHSKTSTVTPLEFDDG